MCSCWSGARGGLRNDQGAGETLLGGKAEGFRAVQPGEEKAPGKPCSSLPIPEGSYKKGGDRLFIRTCCDRTRSNGFKLEQGRFRLDIRKKFFTIFYGGETLDHVPQRSGRCPIPGNVEGQVEWGSEQPD